MKFETLWKNPLTGKGLDENWKFVLNFGIYIHYVRLNNVANTQD